MQPKWSTKFELKPGKWVFVPTPEAAEQGAAIKKSIEENWKIPTFYFHLCSGGHVEAIRSHLSHKFFAHADVQDFFGSINRSRVTRHLREWFPYPIAREMANASTVQHPDIAKRFILPYGFVQSQAVAGLCLDRSKLGRYLTKLSNNPKLAVSVYVDDIIVSSNDEGLCLSVLDEMEKAASESKLTLNPKKKEGPAEMITAFNIEIKKDSMQLSEERLQRFIDAFMGADSEHQRQGIMSYVKSVNGQQLDELAHAAGINE